MRKTRCPQNQGTLISNTKGVYREEGMQLTMTVRTHQTLYQRPDMLKIESYEARSTATQPASTKSESDFNIRT